MRVGTGYDVHRLVAGRPLVLGGVRIPHALGLLGHSDADALLHAVCDALLGAAALGDLGRHFPSGDPRYENADSRELLRTVVALLGAQGWRASNLDCTVVAERPRLAPYIEAMRDTLAGLLGLTRDRVSVKATTTEGLGYIGREEGIAAQAVVLIESAPAGG
ncbi:MAG: 2-C-methyl-D-erythritol 2,4-cyclodiphosphate synthase [Candidatus Lambdaproteobacteria bacterium]|nr:2-C-methyl-D-erythritol 2,4-cyclodiphosphate synthase [Candidatus Lambdaproteobacteria bacterium]